MTATVSAEAHSPLLKALDLIASAGTRLGLPLGRLDADGILASASRATGLQDFGDPAFQEPMRHMLDVVESAPLSALGRIATRASFEKAARNRLLLTSYLERNPAVLDTPIRRPVFVLGFPRTGTTVLQNLLCLDDRRRGLAFWELASPVPVHDDPAVDRARRIRSASRMLRAAYLAAPEMAEVHWIGAETPEECWPLFFNSFSVLNFDLQTGQRAAGDYLYATDMAGAYREYATWLKLLVHANPTEQLVLKCPEHLWFLDALLEVFPDAAIVQTHRDPVDVVASYCSMISMQWRTLYGSYDPRAIGDHIKRRFQEGIGRAMATRQRHASSHFYDVDFSYFVNHQAEVVRDIGHYFDLPWSAETDSRIDAWLGEERADSRGKHRYLKERYGIVPEEIYEMFADYIEAFDVPLRHREAPRLRATG